MAKQSPKGTVRWSRSFWEHKAGEGVRRDSRQYAVNLRQRQKIADDALAVVPQHRFVTWAGKRGAIFLEYKKQMLQIAEASCAFTLVNTTVGGLCPRGCVGDSQETEDPKMGKSLRGRIW